jgi:integrase
MACVVKRRGKYVHDYYDQHGKRRWETTKGNRKEVELLLAQRLQEIERGDFQAKRDQAEFDDLADGYIANAKVKVRDITAREYEEDIRRHIVPFFAGRRVRSITSKDVEDFRSWLIKRGEQGVLIAGQETKRRKFGRATVNKFLTLLSMMFGYAERHSWIASNPAAHIEKVQPAKQDDKDPEAVALERDEIARLLEHAGEPWRLMIRTAVNTGLRQAELLGLRWDDVDLDIDQLQVRRSFREGSFYDPKSRTSRRRVPLSGELVMELKRWNLACPKAPAPEGQPRRLDLVFPTTEGNPQNPSNLLSRGLYPALKRAGLRRIRFHDLRHTFGSHLLAAGVDLKTVSTLMGHSSINVTVDIYGHMLRGSDRDAINRLELALG